MYNETHKYRDMLAAERNKSRHLARLERERAQASAAGTEDRAPVSATDARRVPRPGKRGDGNYEAKMLAISRVQRWLNWRHKRYPRRNAWRMLLLELWCRTPKARLVSGSASVCDAESAVIAHQYYW